MPEKIPVIELFGPVFQGEGPLVGTQTYFLRTGGCDYRCTKCDSLHAVLPEQIKELRTMMTPQEIAHTLLEGMNRSHTDWLTLSGGNPAMWDLSAVIDILQANGKSIAIETQGSVWNNWIAKCDSIVVSPKGPGMGYGKLDDLEEFMRQLMQFPLADVVVLKVPILFEPDIGFAAKVAKAHPDVPLFLSVGNYTAPATHFDVEGIRRAILNWAGKIEQLVLKEPSLARARLFPQQHVLVHGSEKGR